MLTLFVFVLFLLSSVGAALPKPKIYCRENDGDLNNWIVFNRPNKTHKYMYWCIGVFLGNVSQLQAEKNCVMKGARLGTLQTIAEVGVISNKASKSLGRNTGTLWIGLNRKNECLNQKLTKSCTKKTSFTLTDTNTDPTLAFNFWAENQPNNLNLNENCAVLLYGKKGNDTIEEGGQTWTVGQYYDTPCDGIQSDGTTNVNRAQVGYVCGKLAKKRE